MPGYQRRRPASITLVLLGGGVSAALGGCAALGPAVGPVCEKVWADDQPEGWLECEPPSANWVGTAPAGWYGGVWFGGGILRGGHGLHRGGSHFAGGTGGSHRGGFGGHGRGHGGG